MITTPRFRLNKPLEEALAILAACFKAEIIRRHRDVVWTEDIQRCLTEVATELVNEKPKFGFFFCGNVGNGKTSLMYAIQRCINYLADQNHFEFLYEDWTYKPKIHMRIVDIREILVASKGEAKEFEVIRKFPFLGIDDLGKEPAEIMDFGNVLNPFHELLEYRYQQQLYTVITSNVPPDMVKEKYGERISNRIKEMLVKVVFKNTSYR